MWWSYIFCYLGNSSLPSSTSPYAPEVTVPRDVAMLKIFSTEDVLFLLVIGSIFVLLVFITDSNVLFY